MIDENIIRTENNIVVRSSQIEIVLNETYSSSVVIQLPSAKEIEYIKCLSNNKCSLHEMLRITNEKFKEFYEVEIENLNKKYEQNKEYSTYLSRLSSLNELAGYHEESEDILRGALKIDSNNYFKNKLAELYIFHNKEKEVIDLFSPESLSNDIKANINLALACIKNNDINSAELFINQALEIDNLDYEARYLAGSYELIKGNLPIAIRHFKIAIEESIHNIPSSLYVNMGIAYLFLKNIKKAKDSFRKAVSLNPINKNAVFLYGNLLVESKNYSEAIRILKYFINYDQKELAIWDLLAKAYYNSKDFKNALDSLKHQASLEENSAVWNNIAIVYRSLKEYDKAKEYFFHGLKYDLEKGNLPTSLIINLYRFLSDCKYYQEFDDLTNIILPIIKKRHKIDNDIYLILLSYFESLSTINIQSQNIEYIERLIEENDLDSEIRIKYYNYFMFFYSLIILNTEKALSYSRKIINYFDNVTKLDKSFQLLIYNNVICTLLEADMLESSETYLNNISIGIHKSAYPTATLGLYHLRKGDVDKAKKLYEEAINLANRKEEKSRIRQKLNYELAIHYQRKNRKDTAIDYYTRAAKIENGYLAIKNASLESIKRLKG